LVIGPSLGTLNWTLITNRQTAAYQPATLHKHCTFKESSTSNLSMRRSILIGVLAVMAIALLWAQQRSPVYAPYEFKALLPREVSPAQYQQADQRELESIGEQGWELVSVVPYIYKNEERGPVTLSPRPIVTMTYPAYYFKRLRVVH
jgi:hypothetical protein